MMEIVHGRQDLPKCGPAELESMIQESFQRVARRRRHEGRGPDGQSELREDERYAGGACELVLQ